MLTKAQARDLTNNIIQTTNSPFDLDQILNTINHKVINATKNKNSFTYIDINNVNYTNKDIKMLNKALKRMGYGWLYREITPTINGFTVRLQW